MTSSLYLLKLDEVEHAHGAITSVSKKKEEKLQHLFEVEVDEIIGSYYFVSMTDSTSR